MCNLPVAQGAVMSKKVTGSRGCEAVSLVLVVGIRVVGIRRIET